jgi:hypothetical protein
MADNDFNTIKPVDSLHNIAGLTPAGRREQRKRRHNLHPEAEEEPEQEPGDSVDERSDMDKLTRDDDDPHSIDYRA